MEAMIWKSMRETEEYWCWQDDRMPVWMNKEQLMREKDYVSITS